MNTMIHANAFKFKKVIYSLVILLASFLPASLLSQPKLTLELDKPAGNVSPKLYGLMTEEINYSYDGGLYAELIRNRIFKDARTPDHWSVVHDKGDKDSISLDNKHPINEALTVCLRLDVEKSGKSVGIANEGYWGIPVRAKTVYQGSFYAKASNTGKPLLVSIEGTNGKTIYASTEIAALSSHWQHYIFSLPTGTDFKPTADTRFVISTKEAGSYWFNLVSLFPPTYHKTSNGNRSDIMELLSKMKPSFLRFPGGNYLEGQMFSTRFDWKKTLGGLEKRPGHLSPWNYRSSDGMGLLEFLEWCEDLKMEPLLAVFAGYTLNKDYLDSGALLKPFVDEALEEIEYVIGDTQTKWGAIRAANGHPKPFSLSYVEVGNEDGFDVSGSYERRFKQFNDAIKQKYPQLHIISTVGGKDPLGARVRMSTMVPEVVDEHYYRSAGEMEEDANHSDNYNRSGPKVFVGEWATREGDPTTNFNAALGDAAWMTGMERNSDLVIMSCYAPLFVNVNPGGMQWKSDLIGYNALNSFGSPSYYAQTMFSNYIGDKIVPIEGENIPTGFKKLTRRDSAAGITQKVIPTLFYVATRNSQTGKVYLKVVNTSGQNQSIAIEIKGSGKVVSNGSMVLLKADKPEETNSINEPERIIPVISSVNGISKNFNRTFPAYSITVLEMETK